MKLCREAKGSHPGDNTKIKGVVLLDSLKLAAMFRAGTSMNSCPMWVLMNCLMANMILSGLRIRYITMRSISLKKVKKR